MSLYVWGKGADGVLGLGSTDDILDPTLVEDMRSNIVAISAGDRHAMAITDLGDIYVWGRGREGQHGDDRKHLHLSKPNKIKYLRGERITAIECGSYHCIAINQRGHVYEWGLLHKMTGEKDYFSGTIELAGMSALKKGKISPSDMPEWKKRREEMLERSHRQYYDAGSDVSSAVGGADVVTSDITNFGTFEAFLEKKPTLIQKLLGEKIISASAGYSFSLVLTEDGRLFSWGFNEKRQLGLGHRYNQQYPQLVQALLGIKIVKVCCGEQHVVAIDDQGIIYSWGLGIFGQLGHGNINDCGYPTVVEQLSGLKIVDIACGSHHCLALTDDGEVYTWGSSEYYQQASTNEYEDWGGGETAFSSGSYRGGFYSLPRPIDGFGGSKIVKISCGNLHNVAVSSKGEVFTWGWGIEGALGHGNRRFKVIPTMITRIRSVNINLVGCAANATMIVADNADSSYSLDFMNLVNNEYRSDLVFKFKNNRRLYCHSVLVFPRCEYLRKYVEIWRILNEDSEIELLGITYHVYLGLIRYLYTDQLKIASHHIPNLTALAKKYELPRLFALCNSRMLWQYSRILTYRKSGH
eukprot:TRINITY_DN8833_c0_g1_i2.p1 TRINITY_DN8833_c0_g1~~TRINITY_DN8833_c0_g1_i2.p1  ORF type:complete len:580 (-),score=122.04 TRINITY_DN8833_c0_g1_i2:587-2326(-)